MSRLLLLGSERCTTPFTAMIDGDNHQVVTSNDGRPFDIVVDLEIVRDPSTYATRRDLYGEARIVIVNALCSTATAASQVLGMPGVVATTFLPGVTPNAAHIELAPAMQCDRTTFDDAVAIVQDLIGRPVERVEDRVALVSARVLAMIINEAAFAVMEGVASASDIDTAMKLGTNYPNGPLAWCDAIGGDIIVTILDGLYDEYREERYRACTLLRQYSRAARSFTSA
jgi:3-hydroxybutyryl-CoA dehydrogenase